MHRWIDLKASTNSDKPSLLSDFAVPVCHLQHFSFCKLICFNFAG